MCVCVLIRLRVAPINAGANQCPRFLSTLGRKSFYVMAIARRVIVVNARKNAFPGVQVRGN